MIKALLRTVFVFIIFLSGFITFLLTPTGLRFSADTISHFLPGKLTIKNISGIIVGPFTLTQLHYQDKELTLDIGKLYINWKPLDLLKRELRFQSIKVDDLHIITSNSDLPREWTVDSIQQTLNTLIASLKRRTLPFHAMIDHADLVNAEFTDPASHFTVKTPHLFLRAILTANQWDTEIVSTLTKPQPFKLYLFLKGTPENYNLHFNLNGAHTHWELLGIGNIESLTLTTPQQLFLNGSLQADFYIHWRNILKWQGNITTKKIDLSLLNPDWIKWVSLNMNSTGSDSNPLVIDNNAVIATPYGTANIVVHHNKNWHIQWNVNLQSLPSWITTLKGQLKSQGVIDGQDNNPHFHIALNGQSLNTHDTNTANITLDGDFLNHVLSAKFLLQKQKIKLKLDGHLHPNHAMWTGNLSELTAMLDRSITLKLTHPVILSATKNTAHLSPLCLQSPAAGNLCLQGQWLHNKIMADLHLTVTQFEFLHRWLKLIHIPGGKMHGQLSMNGTFSEPNITGNLKLDKGDIYFPRLNMTLSNINATLSGSHGKLNIDAQAFSQKVPLTLKGYVNLWQPDFIAEGQLTANQVLIMNTEEYTILITPNLKANIKNKAIFLTGTVNIPSALIHPNDFQITNTLPVHDVVYIGDIKPPSKPFWQVHNDVIINLGNNVVVRASGVNAKLGGSIRLTQQPNDDLFGTGDILLRSGDFKVYGQTLTISPDSYLSYSNAFLENPTLNIKASKIISDVQNLGITHFSQDKLIVGIALRGTVNAPKITFFSNRASLSQSDILSYILLGYGNDSNTPGNTDFLLRALAAVRITSQGLLGKENIASQIQSGLGLRELGVESETTVDALGNPINQQSAFVVGKSLTKRVYMRVSFGILSPVNVYQVGYMINRHWTLEGSSSTLGNGGDILYTFSKN